MSADKDRIIELWLGEVLGGRKPPDVLERVQARLAQERRSHRRVRVLAACAVAVLALTTFLLVQGTSRDHTGVGAREARVQRVRAGVARIRAVDGIGGLPLAERLRLQKAADAAVHEIVGLALEAPEDWVLLRRELAPLLAYPADVRDRALEVIARGPAPQADPDLLAVLAERPSPVSINLALLLAERGLEQATALLQDLLGDERAGYDRVYAAAHFGLRGDPRGVDLLRWFQDESGVASRSPSRLAASAAARRALGDRDAWARALAWARRQVLSADWTTQRAYLVDVVAANLGYYGTWRPGTGQAPPAQSDLRLHVEAFAKDGLPPIGSRDEALAYLDSLASGD